MVNLLHSYNAVVDVGAKNGLTPMHLCAQEDRVGVATILKDHGASIDPSTKAGYTPLHTASHFGQINMGKSETKILFSFFRREVAPL
jgi:ankyrin